MLLLAKGVITTTKTTTVMAMATVWATNWLDCPITTSVRSRCFLSTWNYLPPLLNQDEHKRKKDVCQLPLPAAGSKGCQAAAAQVLSQYTQTHTHFLYPYCAFFKERGTWRCAGSCSLEDQDPDAFCWIRQQLAAGRRQTRAVRVIVEMGLFLIRVARWISCEVNSLFL